jgi:CDP-diacylglycerol---glycerol-3-phosphate 3-phosphatidyltransferase
LTHAKRVGLRSPGAPQIRTFSRVSFGQILAHFHCIRQLAKTDSQPKPLPHQSFRHFLAFKRVKSAISFAGSLSFVSFARLTAERNERIAAARCCVPNFEGRNGLAWHPRLPYHPIMATASPQSPPAAVFNLPNGLTLARLGLAVLLFICIAVQWWLIGLVLFVLAAITDWLDGYLARKHGSASAFGRNFDPLVDKVLICGAFIFLLGVDGAKLSAWMVTVVVARELIITGLRSFFEAQSASFGADWLGKLKMGLQCAALIAILVVLWWGSREGFLVDVQIGLIYAMLFATTLSGLQYLWRALLLLRAV